MKRRFITILSTASAMLFYAVIGSASGSDTDQVKALLKSYERVLNGSDVPGVLSLYAEDGVFMAQHRPSAIGQEQLEEAYTAVFQAIKLDVEFDIAEVEVIAPHWAFARTNSSGTTTINASGAKVSEGNQELFVLNKIDGHWKIARYGFSTTNPPR